MNVTDKFRLVAAVALSVVASSSFADESWSITEAQAGEIVLSAYPAILQNAHMVGPVEATLQSDVAGFAKSGDKVWHVRIHCDKGGPNALFFVHPNSGESYPIMKPGEKGSTKCK